MQVFAGGRSALERVRVQGRWKHDHINKSRGGKISREYSPLVWAPGVAWDSISHEQRSTHLQSSAGVKEGRGTTEGRATLQRQKDQND